MSATAKPPAAAGPSTTTNPTPAKSTHKSKLNPADRQHQRRWIQLIDAWHFSPHQIFDRSSRDQLVEEISQHAQTLCRSIKDRDWLLNAFQLGIHGVLFPGTGTGTDTDTAEQDAEELSRVEQLGQQLLQLAIHSVAAPHLRSLKDSSAQSSKVFTVGEALERFERWSRRLSMYERLRGLTEMLGLPTLPLKLVLEEEAGTVLLCLASLPQGAELVGLLLGSLGWLVEESAAVRLEILGQLLTAGSGGDMYATLAGSGLLIGWTEGRESGIWGSTKGVQPLSLAQLTDFYRGVLKVLRDQARSKAEMAALLEVLAKDWKGEDAQRSIAELRSAASVQNDKTTSSTTRTRSTENSTRFNLGSIQSLATQISATGTNNESQKQLAKQLLSTNEPASIANQLAQLIDTNDGAHTRAIALTVVSEAATTGASGELASLAAAVVYARPAVGGFRLDLNTHSTLPKQASKVLSQLLSSQSDSTAGNADADSHLQSALRSALDVDEQTFVPACQLLALLRANPSTSLVEETRTHLNWLQSISILVEGLSNKPELDLCWLAAYGGSLSEPTEGGGERKERQERMLQGLVEMFNAANTPPSSLGGRVGESKGAGGAGGSDRELIKFRAGWDGFFHRMLELCDADTEGSAPFSLIPQDQVLRLLLSTILRTGDVSLFSTLSSSSPSVSGSELEDLVLSVSTSLFDKSSIASTRSKDIRLSLEVLSALPSTSARAAAQRNFIEAACRLSSFKIKSVLKPGETIGPREIRETEDKLELVARLLGSQGDAHRSPELVLDLANRLSSLSDQSLSTAPMSDKALIEARVLAMLSDAATSAEDFEQSASFCSRLVSASTKPRASSSVVELAWKSCFQLSKHPGWEDTPQRLTMLGHAMSLAPPQQLGGMLRMWRELDRKLTQEVEGGKQFASTKKAAAGMGMGAGGWSGKGMGGMGELLSAQTGVAAGLVGSAANLLPLSFSPLSYFNNNAVTQGVRREGAGAATGAEVDERTAKLFDFDGVSGATHPHPSQSSRGDGESAAYVDPTERAVRAARAARDFLGWKSEKHPEGQGEGGAAAGGLGGFSLSRGVGWLIGDGERR